MKMIWIYFEIIIKNPGLKIKFFILSAGNGRNEAPPLLGFSILPASACNAAEPEVTPFKRGRLFSGEPKGRKGPQHENSFCCIVPEEKFYGDGTKKWEQARPKSRLWSPKTGLRIPGAGAGSGCFAGKSL